MSRIKVFPSQVAQIEQITKQVPPFQIVLGIFQSGSTAPIITVLKNETDIQFTATREGTGHYRLNFSKPIPSAARELLLGAAVASPGERVTIRENSSTQLRIDTFNAASNAADAILANTSLTINIYG